MRLSLSFGCLSVAAVATSLLTACATGTYTPPQAPTQPNQYERVVNRPFDETWTSLIDYTSGAFFAIDKFEKASGLMTLSFGSSEPWRFIDCGQMKAQAAAKSVDMPYAQFLTEQYGAKLDGRMNILAKPLESRKTLVRVNARYIFMTPAQQNFLAQSWTFDSGSQATVTVAKPIAGTIPTRTCRPTYAAEKAVLDAVGR